MRFVKSLKLQLLSLITLFGGCVYAQQANDTVIFNYLSHYYYLPESQGYSACSPLIDRLGRNYVYVASKEKRNHF